MNDDRSHDCLRWHGDWYEEAILDGLRLRESNFYNVQRTCVSCRQPVGQRWYYVGNQRREQYGPLCESCLRSDIPEP